MNNRYRELMDQITPGEAQKQEIIYKMKTQGRKAVAAKKKIPKRLLVAAACLILAVCLSLTVLAQPQLRRELQDFSTGMLLMLQPVQEETVYDDIKLTVTYAGTEPVKNGDDVAVVYFTMQDLSGRGRINETVDLYTYDVKGFNAGTCMQVGYDKETGIATFKMIMRQFEGRGSNSWKSKGRISVSSYLLNGKETKEETGFALSKILETPHDTSMENVYLNGYSGRDIRNEETWAVREHWPVLKRDVLNIRSSSADWLSLSNLALVDNQLHIQIKADGPMAAYNSCLLSLLDESGEELRYVHRLSFTGYTNKGFGEQQITSQYDEYVFDIKDVSALDKYRLTGSFQTYETVIEGEWKVTFPFQPEK